jgi:hypothetical protein
MWNAEGGWGARKDKKEEEAYTAFHVAWPATERELLSGPVTESADTRH